MALTRTQINDYVTKMQGSSDLGPGGVMHLKDVLNALNGAMLVDAPSNGTTYGRNNGAWSAISAGAGNSQIIPLDFAFNEYKASNGASISWINALRPPVMQVLTPVGMDPDEMMLYAFTAQLSGITTGVGGTVTVHTSTGYSGQLDVALIGV